MMSSFGVRQAHAVCVPFPAQGHVNPMMQLAKLLHSKGFHITFVNTEFIHRQVSRSAGLDSIKGLSDFRFETIPDGLPRSELDDASPDVPCLCDSTRKNCLEPFRKLLRKLNSSSEVPPVSCIVSDAVMSFCIKAAEELSIPQVQFWTASACSFIGYLHFTELIERGFIPFKEENFLRDGDTPIDWIPGLNNIRLKDLPSFIRTTNDELLFDFLRSETQNCLKSSAIIFNTFDEFEHDALEAIIATKFPRIYTVGPLVLLANHMPDTESKSLGSSLWKEDSSCLDWLDKRKPTSVVYVNFGSVALMRDENLKEFAWGLANSNHPFLWIIRPDLVMGESAVLSKEFLEDIGDRGLLVSWCPQDRVLAHPSIGVFLTHCGWNSILEAVCGGVPLICWHFFADQHTNCRYACVKWGIGVEVDHDVKRNEIEALVKEMIEGNGGKEMRLKALEWKKKAEKATDVGGSSHNNFTRFLYESLRYSN